MYAIFLGSTLSSFAYNIFSDTVYPKQQTLEKQDKETIGVFIKQSLFHLDVQVTESSEKLKKIKKVLLGDLGENFKNMTPLQKKSYLASEAGKRKVAELEKEREKLFNTTWCFAFQIDCDKCVEYDLNSKNIMIKIADAVRNEPIKLRGEQFKFKNEYLYTANFGFYKEYFLGLPCSESIATEIENNAGDLILYLYFKVPDMNAIIEKYYSSEPELSVTVDKIELKNYKTNKTYITA